MAIEITEPGFLENIGFLITYKCQISCPHCVVGAGPNRHEEMETNDVFNWIGQAADYRQGKIKTVCFTGGEPFYDLARLRQYSLFAVSRGMLPTVVTNAFWAGSMEEAIEILQSIPYLRVISVSADSHHQTQIPFERVENALRAAKELGLMHYVSICTEDENDHEHMALLSRLEQIVERELIGTVITFPAGRALKAVEPSRYQMTDAPPQGACISAHTPTIFPDGRVFACIGPVIDLHTRHPLLLGDLNEKSLARILDDAEDNPVLHLLRVWGPAKLYELIEQRGLGKILPRQFVKNSICNLCYTLMSDAGLREAIIAIAEDKELVEKTAYARLHYLNEPTMIEMMREVPYPARS